MRIILATNTSKTTVKKVDGKYQINGIPVTVDNAVMNGIKYTAEENAKGMSTLNKMPMSLTHPEDEDGRNVSIFSPSGIDFYSGGKVTNTYNKNGVWYADSEIDEKKLRASEQGEYFANRLDGGEPIGVSTGLTFEANNQGGEGYSSTAINQKYDHLAMLHESERPAGGDATVMRFNGEDVQVVNFDDIEVGEQAPSKGAIQKAWNAAKRLFGFNEVSHSDIRDDLNRAIDTGSDDDYTWVVDVFETYFIYERGDAYYKQEYTISDGKAMPAGEVMKVEKEYVEAKNGERFDNKGGTGYNSQEFDNNDGDSLMNRDEMLEALGLTTNSQITDDELKTLMKSKLASNASEGFTKEDVQSIVNEAIKPLTDQITANAEQELEKAADDVAALDIGINKEAAKAMGLEACNAVLEKQKPTHVNGSFAPSARTSNSQGTLLDAEMPE